MSKRTNDQTGKKHSLYVLSADTGAMRTDWLLRELDRLEQTMSVDPNYQPERDADITWVSIDADDRNPRDAPDYHAGLECGFPPIEQHSPRARADLEQLGIDSIQ